MGASDGAGLTLRGFLSGLFPPWVPETSIHICAFPGVPSAPGADWQGFRLSSLGMMRLPIACNQYFCIGVLDPKSEGRLGTNVVASPIVALDDVGDALGSKVRPSVVRALLTDKEIKPAAVVETSPRNYSVFYKITPAPTDADAALGRIRLAALRRRLADLGLTDPATSDPARYMRLPWGVNGKQGFHPRLVKWTPTEGPLAFELWAAALWSDQDMQRAAMDAEAGSTLWHLGDRGASLSDPLVQLAEEIGLDPRATRPGVIEADCPFAEEHSSGDTTGFAFVNWGRCHCHHGHCASRHSGDFQARMIERYDQQIAIGLLDGSYRFTVDDTTLLDRAGTAVPASGMAFLAARAFELIGLSDIDNPPADTPRFAGQPAAHYRQELKRTNHGRPKG